MGHDLTERAQWAQLWHTCSQVSREDIFGPDDPLRPIYPIKTPLEGEVDIPAIGMVGPNYSEGGVVVVSVNPAGGSANSKFLPSSGDIYMTIDALRHAPDDQSLLAEFERVNDSFIHSMPEWPIWNQYVARLLAATGNTLAAIAYLYLVPFRTIKDEGSKMNNAAGKRYCTEGYQRNLHRQLEVLRPRLILCVDRLSEEFCRLWAKNNSAEVIYFTRKRDAHAERADLLKLLEQRFSGRSNSVQKQQIETAMRIESKSPESPLQAAIPGPRVLRPPANGNIASVTNHSRAKAVNHSSLYNSMLKLNLLAGQGGSERYCQFWRQKPNCAVLFEPGGKRDSAPVWLREDASSWRSVFGDNLKACLDMQSVGKNGKFKTCRVKDWDGLQGAFLEINRQQN